MPNALSLAQTWPDRQTFWQNKRVIVTGGSGFLGSFVVDKLREHGAAEVIVPRRAHYDLRDIDAIRQLFADAQASAFRIVRDSSRCLRRRHRRQPRQAGRVLL